MRSKKGGNYLLSLKDNQKELLDWAKHIMRYPEDDSYEHHEVRSGWVWEWRVRVSSKLAAEMQFPGLRQVVEVQRRRVSKATGEIKEQLAYFLTSLDADAPTAYRLVRKRWGIENRLHHKRDTVFAEDKCRTRKGAQTFAALRNLLIGLLHQLEEPVLRSVRHFSANPDDLYRLLLQGT